MADGVGERQTGPRKKVGQETKSHLSLDCLRFFVTPGGCEARWRRRGGDIGEVVDNGQGLRFMCLCARAASEPRAWDRLQAFGSTKHGRMQIKA